MFWVRQSNYLSRSYSSTLPPFLILGIETSFDDTSVALIDAANKRIYSSIKLSQSHIHEPFKGVFPRLAAEAHKKNLPAAMKECLRQASDKFNHNSSDKTIDHIKAIAATRGPGLASCLSVGYFSGRLLSATLGKPFFPVHHMEAHALVARMTESIAFPFYCLLISGGHTMLVLVNDVGSYQIMAQTLDDAVGEAIDKAATALDLSWMGHSSPGPAFEKYAKESKLSPEKINSIISQPNSHLHNLPFYKNSKGSFDFSFAGLKSAFKRFIEESHGTDFSKEDYAKIFLIRITDHIIQRTEQVFSAAAKENKISSLVVSGGVASNLYIRNRLMHLADKYEMQCYFPPVDLCTDNATMIAWAAYENILKLKQPLNEKELHIIDHDDNGDQAEVKPIWSLEDLIPLQKHDP